MMMLAHAADSCGLKRSFPRAGSRHVKAKRGPNVSVLALALVHKDRSGTSRILSWEEGRSLEATCFLGFLGEKPLDRVDRLDLTIH